MTFLITTGLIRQFLITILLITTSLTTTLLITTVLKIVKKGDAGKCYRIFNQSSNLSPGHVGRTLGHELLGGHRTFRGRRRRLLVHRTLRRDGRWRRGRDRLSRRRRISHLEAKNSSLTRKFRPKLGKIFDQMWLSCQMTTNKGLPDALVALQVKSSFKPKPRLKSSIRS